MAKDLPWDEIGTCCQLGDHGLSPASSDLSEHYGSGFKELCVICDGAVSQPSRGALQTSSCTLVISFHCAPMEYYNIIQGTLYLLVTVTGVVGNILIMLSLAFIAYQEGKLATSEIILFKLAAANLILYLTKTLPVVLFHFGMRDFFDDASCKVTTLAFWTSRGMVIGLTCLLSCFQCAILSAKMAGKQKIHSCVAPVIAILYLTNLAVNIDVATFTTNRYNSTDMKYVFNPGFCFIVFPGKISFEAKGYATVALDLIFVVLMSLASSHILLVLHRHRKKMKNAMGSDQSQRTGAESQAAKTVVLLVSWYVMFYGIDTTLRLYQTASKEVAIMLSDIRVFFTMCYGSVFPIILIVFNKKIQTTAHHLFCKKALP